MSSKRLAFRLSSMCVARRDVIHSHRGSLTIRNLCRTTNPNTSAHSYTSNFEERSPSPPIDKHEEHITNTLQETTFQNSTEPSSSTAEEIHDSSVDNDADIRRKIVFNSHLYQVDPEQHWLRQKILETKAARQAVRDIQESGYAPVRSVSLKYLEDIIGGKEENITAETETTNEAHKPEEENVHFPFAADSPRSFFKGEVPIFAEEAPSTIPNRYLPRKLRIEKLQALNSDRTLREKVQKAMDQRWMSDYEYFKEGTLESWQKMYGTPQKDIPVSKIPCGGCGALFQCQEPAIPGYLPSEILVDLSEYELKSVVCQRCHFLKNYEIALDVQVPPAEYPAVLDTIASKQGLVILIVDLLDFPCSIWPGLTKLIGERKPVIVVGNKVDLLPGDHIGYLNHIKQSLKNSLDEHGLKSIKLKNIRLISARSGYGVEDLITELQNMSQYKGDVFLLGCTNVGKSTLFNCLLQSDMCKVQAVDLIQRATTSQWPNTTLNLLKFPMMRPPGWKLEQRLERLRHEKNSNALEQRLRAIQLRSRHLYHMPTLMQFVGRTFANEKNDSKDVFNARTQPDSKKKLGLDEEDPLYKESRWCYDTPGVSPPDQILNLLTTEELLEVLPSSPLVPQTFRLRLGQSLFVGGLARIDFLDGEEDFIWVTLFASDKLPVTVVWTHHADEVYQYAVGTEVLRVPHSGESRLSRWPGLKAASRPYTLFSDSDRKSGADIVLSSAGWVSVTTSLMKKVTLLPWTPEARGIYFRVPALLPYAVRFRGERAQGTPMYSTKRASPRDDSIIYNQNSEE